MQSDWGCCDESGTLIKWKPTREIHARACSCTTWYWGRLHINIVFYSLVATFKRMHEFLCAPNYWALALRRTSGVPNCLKRVLHFEWALDRRRTGGSATGGGPKPAKRAKMELRSEGALSGRTRTGAAGGFSKRPFCPRGT